MDETTKVRWNTLTDADWAILRRSRLAEITSTKSDEVAFHVVELNVMARRYVVVQTVEPVVENTIGVTATTWRDYVDALDFAVAMAKT